MLNDKVHAWRENTVLLLSLRDPPEGAEPPPGLPNPLKRCRNRQNAASSDVTGGITQRLFACYFFIKR